MGNNFVIDQKNDGDNKMYYNKVEICGVNTAELCLLEDDEKRELLWRAKSGDDRAKGEMTHELS